MDFKWTPKREKAAMALAEGYTNEQSAEKAGVSERTIYKWKNDLEFSMEVDRLSLMVDISGRATRLRLAMRAVRQKMAEDGRLRTNRDILDWLKYAQSETDGVKLDLAALLETATSMADAGSGGPDSETSACGECQCMASVPEQRDGEAV